MLYAIVAVIILIIDQAVKYWTTLNIPLNSEPSSFIPGLIELNNVHNKGAAFGILSDARWFFIILTVVFVVVVVYLLSKNIIKGKLGRWMLVLVMAGGIGNCIDRVINGYVVDMFNFQFMEFAVFNVADIFITVSGVIFCLYLIFHKETAEEEEVASVRTPSTRPLPSGDGRPVRNADYITQLKKPVVEGRKNIEAEMAAKRAEAASAKKAENSVVDWNMPELESGSAPKEKPSMPKAEVKPEPKSEPSIATHTDVISEPVKKPSQPTKKNDMDFTLDDIIAEFKD